MLGINVLILTFLRILFRYFHHFFICLFIVVMQFLAAYRDLVGKGLGLGVLLELFSLRQPVDDSFVVAVGYFVGIAMTFGNLGERFELLAMKSAGISLFRIMRSAFCFHFICIGAFFFSNNVIPVVQMKMWTLMISVQQKSPELIFP